MMLKQGDVVPLEPKIVSAKRIAENNRLAASKQFADDMDEFAGWFMFAVTVGCERKLAEALNASDIETWLPTYNEERMPEYRRGGKRKRNIKKSVVKRLAFDGYIAIRFVPSEQALIALHGFDGVISIVMRDVESWLQLDSLKRLAFRLSDKTIDRFKQMEVELHSDIDAQTDDFNEGETVIVTDGPFLDFTGVVTNRTAKYGAVNVELNIFGRDTPADFWLDQIEKRD